MNNHTTTKGEIPWESEGSFEMVWEAQVFIWGGGHTGVAGNREQPWKA